MFELVELKKDEYENFVKNNKYKSHFLQSYAWGQFCKKEKKMIPYYIGLKNNKKIVATALLLQKKLPLGYSYFYSPRGYVLDYNDKETLSNFTSKLKEFVKKKKGIYIKIDPDIKLQNLTIDGEVIKGDNNFELVNFLKKIGYKHLGFNKAFEHNQPRYTFRLELKESIEDVKNGFHNTTKKVINKGNMYNLEVKKNDLKYIDDFYETMIETAERENLALYSKEYFTEFYRMLHESNESDIYIVYLNKEETKKVINNKINELNEQKEKLKTENKIKEIDNQIVKQEKLLNEVDSIDKEKFPLSSIITAKYGDKVWTIHGGNSSKLRELNSNYLIYYEIIKDAVNDKYKVIDFFGTSYNPVTTDPEYGIYLFKKRLGGEYTEFIGEFDLIINRKMYFLFNKLLPIYRKIVKKKNRKEIKNGTRRA